MSYANEIKKYTDIRILYKPKSKQKNINFQIFGNKFVENNKDKAKIIYNGLEYELKSCFEDIDPNYPNYDKEEAILLTLRVLEDIIDFSEMFHDCEGLYSFPDYYNRENEDIEDIEDYNLTNKTQSMEQTIKYEKLGNKKIMISKKIPLLY